MSYRIERNEEPNKCPKCGGYVTAQNIDWDNSHEFKKFQCDVCGFKYTETWKFQKWEPDE